MDCDDFWGGLVIGGGGYGGAGYIDVFLGVVMIWFLVCIVVIKLDLVCENVLSYLFTISVIFWMNVRYKN